jgi:hypothetical protein
LVNLWNSTPICLESSARETGGSPTFFARRKRKSLVSNRVTHDQYATIDKNWHVIEKEMFTKNARKPPEWEAYVLNLASY